jgi:arsenate reductase
MKRVAFVCYANRIRSQMAEGWARHLAGDRYVFESAGIDPCGPIFPEAVAVMHEAGIDISKHRPKSLDDIDWASVDVAVSLLEVPIAQLVPPWFRGVGLDRPTPDPVGLGLDAHRRTRDQIEATVRQVIRELDEGGS